MIRKPAAPRPAPAQPKPQVSLPPRPAAPRQTFGDIQAAKMAAAPAQQAKMGLSLEQAMKRGNTFGEQQAGKMAAMEQAKRSMEIPPPAAMQAAAQQAIAQSQRAQQNMAPGTRGQGTPLPQYGPQTQPPPAILGNRGMAGGMGPTGPGTQTGGPAPMGMAPPNAAKVGMFKKGGKVCYAGGGKAEEKKESPIPAETLASMKRQAAQEKADRKQAEEQKAGEKEVRDNMGRIGFKKGGSIKASKMGAVKVAKPTMRSASSRADGIAIRGKTRA